MSGEVWSYEDTRRKPFPVDSISAEGWNLDRLRDVPVGAEYRTSDAVGFGPYVLKSYKDYPDSTLGSFVEWHMPLDLVTLQVEREAAKRFSDEWRAYLPTDPHPREELRAEAAVALLPAIREALKDED